MERHHSYLCLALVLAVWSSAAHGSTTTATGISRSLNPAISANGLFVGAYCSEERVHHHHGAEEEAEHVHEHGVGSATGLRVQEVEVQISAFVDPFLKADLVLAVPGGEGLELEEGYVLTQGLPHGLIVKAGKFYAQVGRHNLLHSHQFPFLDPPLVNERLLGGHGLCEAGIGLSYLLPTPWYSEIVAQILNGDTEIFASPEDEDLAYVGHLKSFWDLGEATTLELGGSWAAGNNAHAELSSLAGVDLTVKWRPPRRSRYRGLVWQSEYLFARQNHADETHEEGGFYSLLQYQFARRWWMQGRWDLVGLPKAEDARDWRASAVLAFVPSEFSGLRLQYSQLHEHDEVINQAYLQLNFTIGSHPAHRY